MYESEISCIIVDDQVQAHDVLKHYIGKLGFIQLKGAFLNAIDAYNYLRSTKVDLIFLDINMPEVDGFSFIDMLEYKPIIIITTAYLDYAYKGYESNAIDYLYKPFRFERFVLAVEKACKWKQVQAQQLTVPSFIEIKADGYLQQIHTDKIMYIESLGNYIKIHCFGKTVISFLTTKDVEEKLSDSSFIRIHKSYIVNVKKITGIEGNHLSIGKTVLPIGKTYKKYLDHILKKRKDIIL